MSEKYKRIACSLYDRYEAIASLKKLVDIVYLSDNDEQQVKLSTFISDLFTISKEEFMKLDDDTVIRLDRIVSVREVPD